MTTHGFPTSHSRNVINTKGPSCATRWEALTSNKIEYVPLVREPMPAGCGVSFPFPISILSSTGEQTTPWGTSTVP